MSYILEALKRAQAEREQGQVPGLHAHPVASLSPAPTARAGLGRWALAALLLLAAAGAAVWWSRSGPVESVTATQPAAPAPALIQAPAPAPLSAPANQASAPVSAAVVRPSPALPVVVSAVPALPAPPLPVPVEASSSAPAVAPASAPAPSPAKESVRTVRLAQMSPAQRRELPALSVGGAIWSETPASRFLIIDGQVMREGDAVAPGLVLERIAPKAAWLRWRDLRVELAF